MNITQLPTFAAPRSKIFLPCSKKEIEFRQFLVKEEKILLMGAEKSSGMKDMIEVLGQVIENCTFGQVKIHEIPIFDLEYLFLQLRTKSVGEEVGFSVKCSECSAKNPYSLDFRELKPIEHPEHTDKIVLSEDPFVGICMKYPKIDMLDKFSKASESFDVIISCIDYFYDQESVTYASEYTKEQLEEFLDGMTIEHLKKIEKFFETSPRISLDVDFKCLKCGHDNKYTVKDFRDFFI